MVILPIPGHSERGALGSNLGATGTDPVCARLRNRMGVHCGGQGGTLAGTVHWLSLLRLSHAHKKQAGSRSCPLLGRWSGVSIPRAALEPRFPEHFPCENGHGSDCDSIWMSSGAQQAAWEVGSPSTPHWLPAHCLALNPGLQGSSWADSPAPAYVRPEGSPVTWGGAQHTHTGLCRGDTAKVTSGLLGSGAHSDSD